MRRSEFDVILNDFRDMKKFVFIPVGILLLVVLLFSSSYIIEPGFRGVLINMGSVSDHFLTAGFGFKPPFTSRIIELPIRQQVGSLKAQCYSSDLQQLEMELK